MDLSILEHVSKNFLLYPIYCDIPTQHTASYIGNLQFLVYFCQTDITIYVSHQVFGLH